MYVPYEKCKKYKFGMYILGSVHILYNADGVGVGLGFVIVRYIWWGV